MRFSEGQSSDGEGTGVYPWGRPRRPRPEPGAAPRRRTQPECVVGM